METSSTRTWPQTSIASPTLLIPSNPYPISSTDTRTLAPYPPREDSQSQPKKQFHHTKYYLKLQVHKIYQYKTGKK